MVPNDGTLYLRIGFEVETPEDWADGVGHGLRRRLHRLPQREEIQRSPNLVGSAGNAWDYTDGYLEAVLFNGGTPTWSLGT